MQKASAHWGVKLSLAWTVRKWSKRKNVGTVTQHLSQTEDFIVSLRYPLCLSLISNEAFFNQINRSHHGSPYIWVLCAWCPEESHSGKLKNRFSASWCIPFTYHNCSQFLRQVPELKGSVHSDDASTRIIILTAYVYTLPALIPWMSKSQEIKQVMNFKTKNVFTLII